MKHIVAILLLLCTLAVKAAEADTTIYFVNFYPGPDIYELEGHSAIVVEIEGQQPVAYNFGVFDFAAPNFVYRFVKGQTDYMAVAQPAIPLINRYLFQGRRTAMHRLNFDSAQKARLLDLLNENVRPENRVYRYNYVLDNCATRPLRAVERAAGDSLRLPPAPFEANSALRLTFRNIMRRYHANYPWYQFGIDLALGSGIDYTIDRRQATFAPAELDLMLDQATVGGRPLVSSTNIINNVAPDAAIQAPTPWYLTPLAVCWAVFALALLLTVRDLRRRRISRWFDAAFFGIIGLAGCLLTFLIFISVHEATSPNWLYAWINPLSLLVPALIWIKKAQSFLVCYQIVNFAAVFTLCAAWAWIPQEANAAFLPLLMTDLMRSASYILIARRNK